MPYLIVLNCIKFAKLVVHYMVTNVSSLFRGIYDKVIGELRLMKEELASIERFRGPKERSLAQCSSNLQAMKTTKEGLESELHQVISLKHSKLRRNH